MKKIFQIIGLISLTCFSFFITEKTAIVVSDMDEIMVEIKKNKDNFKTDFVDAIITDKTIIPGINGKVVNTNKSYKNMKQNGYYNEQLYIFDYIKPNISITNNKDKIIKKGNPSKRMASLVFKVTNNTDITNILNILNNYKVKSSFFVDYTWFSNNGELIQRMIKEGHNIGILMDDYTNSNYEWMDMILKKINKQNTSFCYNTNNELNIKECMFRDNYTIEPVTISNKTPLVDIKQKLESGSILYLDINNELKKELSTIIIYIKSKGLNLTNLEENILE